MFGASERLLYLLEIVVSEYNSTLRMTCGYLYNSIYSSIYSVCGLSMLSMLDPSACVTYLYFETQVPQKHLQCENCQGKHRSEQARGESRASIGTSIRHNVVNS